MISTTTKTSSKITFDFHDGETILTEQLSKKPLKIVNPKSQKKTAICMLTNYGGGFVEGDTIALKVLCKAKTTSLVSSQANTRVYESNGIPCRQSLQLSLEENAFHVFFNDPLVMHEGGSFSQENTISAGKNSVLLLIDWFSSGRTANGESFAFHNFETSTKIKYQEEIVAWDNFKITPKDLNIHSPGNFGKHTSFLNLFLIGDANDKRVKHIEKALFELDEKNANNEDYLSNVTRTNDKTLVGRYSTEKIIVLTKIMKQLSTVLADDSLLGYNHLDRKY